jgi:hypothetical protein
VVDDGSTDGTAALAEGAALGDARIRLRSQENAGAAAARNAGADVARGDWLCMLDADDLLAPTFLERVLAFIDAQPGYDIYSANGDMLLANGTKRPLLSGAAWSRARSVTVEEQLRESLVPQTSLMNRRTFELCGGYRNVYSEDYDFWLRALILGAKQIFLPERLWTYRRLEGSKTRALVREAESLLEITRDACVMPQLSSGERAACEQALGFAHARIKRRELEQALLEGRYTGARRAYIAAREAFPDRPKYLLGLAIMLVSPRVYARIKGARMI